MSALDAAILRTIVYADVFNFPLTVSEIHHFLIDDKPSDIDQIEDALARSAWLHERIECVQGFWLLLGRTALVEIRAQHEQSSQYLWDKAMRWGLRLSALPFVRMIGLTGALAMHNAADDDDDLDFMIITQPGRVWLARAFAILMVRIGRLRGVELCPNYIISDDRLMQNRCDLFTAHEVAQLVPIYGHELHLVFRAVNRWTDDFLPNAKSVFHHANHIQPGRGWRIFKQSLEWLLSGKVGDLLENWEYRRKAKRFQPKVKKQGSSAEIDQQTVKGHFNDYGHPALRRYHELLRQYDVELQPLTQVGD